VLKGAESSNAVAAALARLVADGFVLRFLTELLIWHLDKKFITQSELLRQLKLMLDELILAVACRLKVLGGCAPQSLAEIEALSSVRAKSDQDLASACLLHLADEIESMRNVCRMVAAIAGKDGDRATEQLLRQAIGSLEGMSVRVNQSVHLQ
jgi:DNA-binding ferritin-like protein